MSRTFFLMKILLLGDSGVGKSSLIERFCNPSSKPIPSQTVGISFKSSMIRLDYKVYPLRFYDANGHSYFDNLLKDYIFNSDAVVIVYDITRIYTLHRAIQLVKKIKDKKIFLIGNKCDRVAERRVQKTDVSKQIKRLKTDIFVLECSALEGTNCKNSIELIVRESNRDDGFYTSIDIQKKKEINKCTIV